MAVVPPLIDENALKPPPKPPTEEQLLRKREREETPEFLEKQAQRAKEQAIRIEERVSRKRARSNKKLANKTAKEAEKEVSRAANPRKRKCSEKTSPPPPKKPKKEPTPKKAPARRAKSALLDLSIDQRELLNRWFGTFRWTYNQCVNVWQTKGNTDLDILRETFVNADSEYLKDFSWVLETPANLRYAAVWEFKEAVSAGFARKKNEAAKGNADWKFEMQFRSKKKTESIPLLAKYYRDGRPYGKCWCNEAKEALPPLQSYRPKASEKTVSSDTIVPPQRHDIPTTLTHDSKLVRKDKKIFISVALALPLARTGVQTTGRPKNGGRWLESQEPETPKLPAPVEKVVSIDPGVRTFATMYDPSGQLLEWGAGDITRLFRLCRYADELGGRSRKPAKKWHNLGTTSKQRKRMREAFQRKHERIKNLVMELHRKLAKYLCENYNMILLPKFGTSKMVKRAERRISGKAARQMLTWSHYQFQQRLRSKAAEYPWVRVVEVREDYTSKTCGGCGWLHQKLGGQKHFRCRECNFSLDRDFNGARNILLQALGRQPHEEI